MTRIMIDVGFIIFDPFLKIFLMILKMISEYFRTGYAYMHAKKIIECMFFCFVFIVGILEKVIPKKEKKK